MMRIRIFLIIAITLCYLYSCEKETELTIPEPTPELVVNSILEANKLLKVYVGKSNYTLDNTTRYINDATVQAILGESSKIDTLAYTDSGFYVSKNTICTPGVTYKINVTTNEFDKASVNVLVPPTVKFADYSFTEHAGINKSGFDNKLLIVTIPDSEENSNFYMLFLECHSKDSIEYLPDGIISNTTWYSFSPIIKAEGSDEESAFSDELFNGKSAVIPMNFHMWNYADFYDLTYSLTCYLVTISEEYYKYQKSFSLVEETENSIWQVSSPPQLYSNIDNAFGICAAINISDSIIIDF